MQVLKLLSSAYQWKARSLVPSYQALLGKQSLLCELLELLLNEHCRRRALPKASLADSEPWQLKQQGQLGEQVYKLYTLI